MSELPDQENFFAALDTKMSKRRIAKLYRALGWKVSKCAWYDYELRAAWAELEIEGESPILLHDAVADAVTNVEALLVPLRTANISFKAECYGPEKELLKEWISGTPVEMTPAPKRRWLRFALLTGLALLALYLVAFVLVNFGGFPM